MVNFRTDIKLPATGDCNGVSQPVNVDDHSSEQFVLQKTLNWYDFISVIHRASVRAFRGFYAQHFE